MKKFYLKPPLFLCLLLFGWCYNPLYGQSLASIDLPASESNWQKESITIEQALQSLEEEFDVSFHYETEVVKNVRLKKTIENIENKDFQELLSELLDQTGLSFRKLNDQYYLIIRNNSPEKLPRQDVKESVKDLNLSSALHPLIRKGPNDQLSPLIDQTISGQITDGENGEPLPGVNVLAKGTTTGTVTDIDGNYRLTVNDEVTTLVFSSIGYTSQEIQINGRSNVNVVLNPDVQSLSEVVVVGYGTVKKSDLTGSVASLNSESFNPGVQASVDQMIQGRAPGVQVTQASSEPGGGVSIRIRGSASLTAGNEPLYVIDGLPIDNSNATPGSGIVTNQSPRNPLNALNPGDIESIEILKDASATAIYGSRGANGVILITTKKGKKGAMSINYDGYLGTQSVAQPLDMLTGPEYISFLNDLREAQGQAPEFTQEEISTIGDGTDWQDEIFRTAPVQNHQLSLSGGSENTQYYASFNYFDQQGVVISSGTKRYTARLNLNHSLDRFNFGVNLNTSYLKDDFVPFGIGTNEFAGVINSAIFQDPTMPVFDENGDYAQSETVNLENPVGFANGVIDEAETNRTFGNVFAEYKITEHLRTKLNFGSDRQTSRRDAYMTRLTRRGDQNGGLANARSNERSNYLIELTLSYDREFNEKHRINAVGGYTYQEFVSRGLNASARNFATDAFLTNNIAAGSNETYVIGTGKAKNQLLSYLGRVNYTFLDRYLLTTSFRVDGSSRFGEDTKYGYFPSVALGWRLGEEAFISSLGIFSDLKLRASYGITGNQEIGNYNSLVLLGTVGQAIFNESLFVGIAPNQLANRDLKWETTAQFNIGLDYEILEGRIGGSIDYFQKNTSDLLLNLPIPTTSGFNTSLQNIGSTSNSGFEFLINSENLVGNFGWSTTLNLSTIRNEVVDLGGLPFILQGGAGFTQDITILTEGEPINAYYGYDVAGIFQSEEEVAASAQPLARPGELRFRDVDGDNEITPQDRTILGSPYPDLSFGFNNNFSYAGFDLSIFFQGVSGSSIFNFNRVEAENPISFRRNRLADVLNRWTPENPSTTNPSYIPPQVSYGGVVNSRAVEDASYLRLKNIRLGYSFPGLNVDWLSSLSVYFTAQNVFTITNYTGFDPEVSAFGTSNIRADYNAYPLAKIYTLGINIGF
ncbi:TonB-dependent receptor [Catalinimonas sp. 4WD22]|uniref:SusC/RagA family TonB-linked outer membrane protein n=1 Tax=Catalinimonas locisalis TaxID=3133978 RepID=UPI003100E5EC